MLHELSTNAAKYGALSVPGGRLDVTWRRDDQNGCVVAWREQGGPHVPPPSILRYRLPLQTSPGGGIWLNYSLPNSAARWLLIRSIHSSACTTWVLTRSHCWN
jgi:hypothetical protein